MYYQRKHMRLKEFDEIKVATPRRLAAAIRAIKRAELAENQDPLFETGDRMTDDEVREKARDRLEQYIRWAKERLIGLRKYDADQWLLIRRVRRRVPEAVRLEFDDKWGSGIYPGSPEYAADLLNKLIMSYYWEGKK